MEFDEMNRRAYAREAVPDDLTPAERMIYLALALLYELHFRGAYTREQGTALKRQLESDFEQYCRKEREWLRCETAMKLLRRSDIPLVQGVVAEADRMFGAGTNEEVTVI